jgi:hypothetical protein
MIFFGGKHIVGDYADGRLYHLDSDYYTDDGDPLVSVRSAPVVSNGTNRLFHSCLTLEVESGVGLVVDDLTDAILTEAGDYLATETGYVIEVE